MKHKKLNHIHIRLAIVLLLLMPLVYPAAGLCSQNYEYVKADKAAEQKKFVAKLKEDKKKTEMAIISTKALIGKSRNRPYLPDLYLRLAELYVEKSRLVYFIGKNQPSAEDESLRTLEVKTLKSQAIEIYQRILGNFPDYPDRDKVLFFMAHEYREMGRKAGMLMQYREIVDKYRNSSYAPESHLLLGDHYFNEKQDVRTARRHYEAVLGYANSSASATARYKLAWCYINESEFKKAIKLLEDAVMQSGIESPDIDTYRQVDIKLESLVDMAFCYTEAYNAASPTEAIEYFKRYSWSRPVYALVLEKLGYRYFIKKRWPHAVEIYRELSTLNHDAETLLEYAGYIFQCVKTMRNFQDADKDMEYIVKALKKVKYSIHLKDEEKIKHIKDFELYARDIATHLHQKARIQKKSEIFERAAHSYELYLDFFKESPVLKEMKLNYAEALFASEQYLEAGKVYEEIVASNMLKTKKDKQEKLYSAILSYYSGLKKKDEMNNYETVFARDGLKTCGMQFIKTYPSSAKVPEIMFNVAWIYYDEGKYDQAITEFSKFVDRYPRGKEAKVAVHLILDSYNLKEDMNGLVKYGKKVMENRGIDYKLRKEVAQIVENSETKMVSALTVNALNDWEKGRKDLVSLAKDNKSSALGEQALNVLFVSSKDKGDLVSMFSSGSQFMNQYPKSNKVEGVIGDMINASIKASQFRLTAQYLEEFTKRYPNHKNTGDFLFQAGTIRENLGQYDLAASNYQKYLSTSAAKSDYIRDAVFTIAENSRKIGRTETAIRLLETYRKRFSKMERVRADALAANLYFDNKNFRKAAVYQKRAQKAYKSSYGKKDPAIGEAMARMTYHSVQDDHEIYMRMQLSGKLNDKIVAKKAKLLDQLEKTYIAVIQYQSPKWALRACYRSYEINNEFAKFLRESPVPNLSPDQKKQYLKIIAQKAKGYTSKAYQYLETCSKQAHKWELCDSKLTQYYMSQSSSPAKAIDETAGGGASSVAIVEQSFEDSVFKPLHYKLVRDPSNAEANIKLAQRYFEKGDYHQAILAAQKILDTKGVNGPVKAATFNILGLAYVYVGEDEEAKIAFKSALAENKRFVSAKINLAGLFNHYGHTDKANTIYKELPKTIDESSELIHPHAKELYYAYFASAKK